MTPTIVFALLVTIGIGVLLLTARFVLNKFFPPSD
jgi:hypothetical protein